MSVVFPGFSFLDKCATLSIIGPNACCGQEKTKAKQTNAEKEGIL